MTISNDACNGKRLSRRRFVLGTAAASAAMLPGAGFAQNALGELLQAPTRGNWDDQFDTRGSNVRQVASNSPVLSENTIYSLQEAINSYSAIVQGGGWPMVPEGETLKIGVQSRTVPVLRQRLARHTNRLPWLRERLLPVDIPADDFHQRTHGAGDQQILLAV